MQGRETKCEAQKIMIDMLLIMPMHYKRQCLNWDMSVPLGHLALEELYELFTNFYLRVVKLDDNSYPSSLLMGMMDAYNQVIRHASELQALRGEGIIVDKDFNITKHAWFTNTWLVLKAMIRKSANESVTQKTKKVCIALGWLIICFYNLWI